MASHCIYMFTYRFIVVFTYFVGLLLCLYIYGWSLYLHVYRFVVVFTYSEDYRCIYIFVDSHCIYICEDL